MTFSLLLLLLLATEYLKGKNKNQKKTSSFTALAICANPHRPLTSLIDEFHRVMINAEGRG